MAKSGKFAEYINTDKLVCFVALRKTACGKPSSYGAKLFDRRTVWPFFRLIFCSGRSATW
jgi:hypothetical protein